MIVPPPPPPGYREEDAGLRCKNGQSYWPEDSCRYSTDQYGTLQGCRDATHLENCREYSVLQCPYPRRRKWGLFRRESEILGGGESDFPTVLGCMAFIEKLTRKVGPPECMKNLFLFYYFIVFLILFYCKSICKYCKYCKYFGQQMCVPPKEIAALYPVAPNKKIINIFHTCARVCVQ